jgi:hypothetical protein
MLKKMEDNDVFWEHGARKWNRLGDSLKLIPHNNRLC